MVVKDNKPEKNPIVKIGKEKKQSKSLIELLNDSNNYDDMITKVLNEFSKFDDRFIIKPIKHTQKGLKIVVAVCITKKRDCFLAIMKNKEYLKCYTSIKNIAKYLEQIKVFEFELRLNQGYGMNYKNFNIFGGETNE